MPERLQPVDQAGDRGGIETELLRACTVPTLLVLAERSRSLDIRAAGATARRLMPHVLTTVLPEATAPRDPDVRGGRLDRQTLQFLN